MFCQVLSSFHQPSIEVRRPIVMASRGTQRDITNGSDDPHHANVATIK